MKPVQAGFYAEEGFKQASKGEYQSAAEMFSQAIDVWPSDYRFFLNRSFCHFYLKQYDQSLRDADRAIALSDGIPTAKPMYRRALALLALERLPDALEAFERVLLVDQTCPVSLEKRFQIRRSLLQSAGVDLIRAEQLAKRDEDVNQLIQMFKSETKTPQELVRTGAWCHNTINTSRVGDQESGDWIQRLTEKDFSPALVRKEPDPNLPVLEQVMQSMPDLLDAGPVTNPIGFEALVVGNISLNVKKEDLVELFENFGNVLAVNRMKNVPGVQPKSLTVLVQYSDPDSPVIAVQTLLSAIFESEIAADPMRPLTFKLTASQSQKERLFITREEAILRCKSAGECFNWRGVTSCQDENCELLHTRANLRLDSHSYFFYTEQYQN